MWVSNSHVFCKPTPEYIDKILLRELVGALISTALLGIYIRLMYVFMSRSTHFSNAFYKLFTLNGIMACGLHASHMVKKGTLFLAYFGIGVSSYHEPTKWKATLIFFVFAFSLGLNFAQFFLSVNRLSAFILVLSYERVWNTLFPYLSVFTFVVPSLVFCQLFFLKSSFYTKCLDDNEFLDYFTLNIESAEDKWVDYNQIAFYVGITLVISSLLVNGLTIGLFVRYWTSSIARNNDTQSHRFSLILICVLDSFVPLFWELDYILDYESYFDIGHSKMIERICALNILCMEIVLLLPSLWSLLCSKQIRHEFFNFSSNIRVHDSGSGSDRTAKRTATNVQA
ncbi:hypothetical protein M3Y95_00281800 [Aphelenchoides besseyi]|nr:hypothetical protein M3Y95_00281800 [Aphelenchoides besseyi]